MRYSSSISNDEADLSLGKPLQRLHGFSMREVFKRDAIGFKDDVARTNLAALVCHASRNHHLDRDWTVSVFPALDLHS